MAFSQQRDIHKYTSTQPTFNQQSSQVKFKDVNRGASTDHFLVKCTMALIFKQCVEATEIQYVHEAANEGLGKKKELRVQQINLSGQMIWRIL